MAEPNIPQVDNRLQEVIESEYEKARFFIRNTIWTTIGLLVGLIGGYLVYLMSTPLYEARAIFLVDQIPFVQNQLAANQDNERQLVQTIILGIPSSRLAAAVAKSIDAQPKDLAFLALDRPLRLRGKTPRANITVEAVRDSRIGQIFIRSQSADFAVRVGNEILNQLQVVNQLGGQLAWLNLQMSLAQREVESLMVEQTKLLTNVNELERQTAELNEYASRGLPLDEFPAFNSDATLSNLKTQLILVESEFENIAHTSVGGPRLTGKRAEVTSLNSQIADHSAALATSLKAEQTIVTNQLKSLREKILSQENRISSMRNRVAVLAESYGSPNAMREVLAEEASKPTRLASCIIPLQQATVGTRPVRPRLWLDLLFGATFGAAITLGTSVLLHYVRLSKLN